ncbi:MAG: hypothetical protein WC777_00415 [Candidatus Gracilibacteria bacterium]
MARSVWVPIQDDRAGAKPAEMEEKKIEDIFKWLEAEVEPQLFVFCGSFRLVAAVKRAIQKTS